MVSTWNSLVSTSVPQQFLGLRITRCPWSAPPAGRQDALPRILRCLPPSVSLPGDFPSLLSEFGGKAEVITVLATRWPASSVYRTVTGVSFLKVSTTLLGAAAPSPTQPRPVR